MSQDSALEPMLRKLSSHFPLHPADEQALLALPNRTKEFDPHNYVVREREQAVDCRPMLSGFSIRHKIVPAAAAISLP